MPQQRKLILILRSPWDAVAACWLSFVTYFPGHIGDALRYKYFRNRLAKLGKGAVISEGVSIKNPKFVSIGEHTHIDRFVSIVAGPPAENDIRLCHKANPDFDGKPGEVRIGRNIHIAPFAYLMGIGGISIDDDSGIASGAKIYSMSHHHRDPDSTQNEKLYVFSNRIDHNRQCVIVGPVVMKRRSGVGLNSVILPAATIGEDSWLGVNSLLIGRLEDCTLASGNPAKVVRKRTGGPV